MARKQIVDVTANATLSKNQSGSLVVLNKAEGLTVTLPTPGRGLEYDFVIKTAITAAAGYYNITVPSVAASSIKGAVSSASATGAMKHQASSGAEKVRLGTINGGAVGTELKFLCDNDGKWSVSGSVVGTADTTVFA